MLEGFFQLTFPHSKTWHFFIEVFFIYLHFKYFFMKKLFTVSLILLCSVLYSQNQKGEMLLSVAVSPYPTTTNNEDDFGAMGFVSFEFFVSRKVSLSGSFFTTNNTLITDNSGLTVHSYGFIPSITYYFVNKDKWNVFAQAGYGYGFEDQTQGYIQNSALTVYNVGPGTHYKIGKKIISKAFNSLFPCEKYHFECACCQRNYGFCGVRI